jgi:hypothetical protein
MSSGEEYVESSGSTESSSSFDSTAAGDMMDSFLFTMESYGYELKEDKDLMDLHVALEALIDEFYSPSPNK